MKKLFYLPILVLLLAGCSKDDETLPPPSVGDITITGAEISGGKIHVEVGSTLSFTAEGGGEVVRYEWYLDGNIACNTPTFIYSPRHTGQRTLAVRLYGADGRYAERTVCTIIVTDSLRIVDLDAERSQVELYAAVGEGSLRIVAQTSAPGVTSYRWSLGGQAVAGATAESYEISKEYSGTFDLRAEALSGDNVVAARMITLHIEGPYKEGMFFYGTTTEDLAFYNTATSEYLRGNIFEAVNGTQIGAGGINDLVIHDNRIFFLTPGSAPNAYSPSTAFVPARVTVCDAQTLKVLYSVEAEGFDVSTVDGEIYNLAVVDENKFYIGYNASNQNNTGGIGVLSYTGSAATFTPGIAGTTGRLGIESPGWTRMLRNGGHILAACGSRLQAIDTATDAVVKTVEIDPDRQIADIVRGRDGILYAIVAGKADKGDYWLWYEIEYTTNSSVVAIDPVTYEIISETEIDGYEIKSGLGGCNAVASLTSDEIFIAQKADDYAMFFEVYKYNYTTGQTALFTDILDGDRLQVVLAGYMGTDTDGRLYIPTTNWTFSTVGMYDIASGAQVGAPSYHTVIGNRDRYVSVYGDGNVTSTYRFAE